MAAPESFDLASARAAASAGGAGRLEAWVHRYLAGPGGNPAFSEGLRLEPRRWRGPERVRLGWLERTCGPEPGIRFPVPESSWRGAIAQLAGSFRDLEDFPPLIAQYVAGRLLVNDGNHRLGAFSLLGLEVCWVILWYPNEAEFRHH